MSGREERQRLHFWYLLTLSQVLLQVGSMPLFLSSSLRPALLPILCTGPVTSSPTEIAATGPALGGSLPGQFQAFFRELFIAALNLTSFS